MTDRTIKSKSVNQERLQHLLSYDMYSGIFYWKNPTSTKHKAGAIAGSIDKNGYKTIMLDGKNYFAARLAILYVKGYLPNLVDHINNIPSDNSWENLRECTTLQNSHNTRTHIDSKTGIKGVYFCNTYKKYFASVMVAGKTHKKGFTDIETASKYIQEIRANLHKEFYNAG